ncbi:BamA/TamA family outer membrane protein [Shewanella sp. D64]|uniref:BamA/TamA family outer membrane protein n=1 Tax=unclassified Shewanella TaxID=196818 RepID=UPI0022BA34C7|nr:MULTISPECIES: BamA/TamA family outer membrane protein [unclassified Shewanella]MEC4727423.1 BamA/TamA family outer membrane protein [Shewanella sp. D64]MEC4739578.1 BamA/TamA family outer membrane protein [Shewanella sp. E94]WBJ96039.1 BamA/TamA family outer membrane protein [Shewanella sp. MTB7]
MKTFLSTLTIIWASLSTPVFAVENTPIVNDIHALASIIPSVVPESVQSEPTLVPESEGWIEDFLQALGADGEFNPDKLIDFSYLPGPFYNPEMDLGVGISAVGLYQYDPKDEMSQLSSLVINGLASTNGALGVTIANKTFINQDEQRFYLNAEIFDAPDVFYGVGYDNNYDEVNKVEFNQRIVSINPKFLQRMSATSFVGVGVDYSYADASKVDRLDSRVDTDILNESSRSVGVNVLLSHDSRDNVLNPQSGRILEIDAAFYRQYLGSKTDFDVYNALYSEYMKTGRGEDILAWQVRGRFTSGDLPWDQLSKAGGGDRLRGYTSGRYRDKQMLMTQVEYRLNLTGRHGMVFWAGVGAIANDISKFDARKVLPNAGVGYRFEVKPRVNLRLDMAFGDGDSGFYFNVNEAF